MEFISINRDNLYDTIATAIEKKILDGELKPGDKLPSENSLAQMFGVSRNVIRESLREVKEWGLIEVKTGSGNFVCEPKISQISSDLNRMVILNHIVMDDFFDTRMLIEPRAARLAAKYATQEQVQTLSETLAVMQENENNNVIWGNAESQFHCMIARAAKNRFLYIFVASLLDALRVYSEETLHGKYCKEIIRSHVNIYEAIRDHKEEQAEKAMAEHVSEASAWIKKADEENQNS